jgi:hypothetical protein
MNKCVIINVKTKMLVTVLKSNAYDNKDVGGWQFYVEDLLIFETIDQVY